MRGKSSDYAQCAHCYSASVRVWLHGEGYVGEPSLGGFQEFSRCMDRGRVVPFAGMGVVEIVVGKDVA